MRVGTICYATDSGLGILARSFHAHGVVTDVMVIRHGRHPTNGSWYPNAPQITDLRNPKQRQAMREFCTSLDVLLAFETPFDWTLFDHCREKGVKTALMVMYECEQVSLPATPDLILCPSMLDKQYYPQGVFLPVPVEVEWKQRTRAEVFVHNSGHGGLKGRNGTEELLQSIRHVKSPAQFLIRGQKAGPMLSLVADRELLRDKRIRVACETLPYEQLWAEGDVFVFPEKFNGLSLPLQEARAAGMLVMCGDRFPMNTWLPNAPLIPVSGYRKNKIGPPYNTFDEALFDPKAIAATIDAWYGRDITAYSESGREWASLNSWNALKPRYISALENI